MTRKVWTLAAYWPDFAVRRRLHVRDWQGDEGRWELYIAPDPIAAITFPKLKRSHVKQWLARMLGRKLAHQTVKNALGILRVVCADAVDSELLRANPCDKLKLSRSSSARSDDGWTILDPDEQIRLLRSVAPEERQMVAFALHTGMRNSELWSLRTADIDLDAGLVTVRFSKKDLPPKGGRIRRIPLFGMGLEAAKFAVQRGHEFAWPSPRTLERRFWSSHPTRWDRWLRAAGIRRHVRFYDMRHTTATSLLAGWWGRKWSLDEVRQMLGHSTVRITERYAHLIDDTLWRAGKATPGLGTNERTEEGANFRARTGDLRFTNASLDEAFQRLAFASLPTTLARALAPQQPDEFLRAFSLAASAALDGEREACLRPLAKAAELMQRRRHAP